MKGFSFSNNVRLQVFDSFLISQKYGLISLYNTMKGKSDWGKAKDGKEDPTKGFVFVHYLSDVMWSFA